MFQPKLFSFDECRRGAMTQDFMKSWVIAPSLHPPPPNWRVFVETSDFIRFCGGFQNMSFCVMTKYRSFFKRPIKGINKIWMKFWRFMSSLDLGSWKLGTDWLCMQQPITCLSSNSNANGCSKGGTGNVSHLHKLIEKEYENHTIQMPVPKSVLGVSWGSLRTPH